MKIFPWICFLAAGVAAFFFYSTNQKNAADVAKLRVEVQEIETLREEVAELKKLEEQVPDIERLQKDAAEVFKLRNEVRQLRTDKQTLNDQVRKLEFQVAGHQQQVQLQQQQQQQVQNQNAVLQQQNVGAQQAQKQNEANACINNLKQLDGATEQWALENKKRPGDLPAWENLVGPQAFIRNTPACPSGGHYTLGVVGEAPLCSVSGHHVPN